jgi:hypothetical protein
MRALALVIALAAASPAAADGVNVTATYEARLLIKIADLRTDQVVGPADYRLGARLTTVGALGVIKPSVLLDQANGAVRPDGLTPAVFVQIEKNGTKRRVVRYGGGGGGLSLADPLTQLTRVALRPGSGSPCVGALPIYDGRQRYDLVLSPAGGAALTGAAAGLGLQRGTGCRLGFRAISGFKGSTRNTPFLRGDPVASFGFSPRASVWVLTDIAIPTVIGTAHIALTGARIDGAWAPPRPPAPHAAPRGRRHH